MTCPTGKFKSAGLCYPKCKDGYTNTGLTCYRAPHTLSGGPSKMTCPAGKFKSAGLCYPKCKSGYTNMGLSCYRGPKTIKK